MIAAVVAVRLVMTGSLVADRIAGCDPIAVVIATIMSQCHLARHGPPGVNAMPVG
jgi:multisubunit Na+/H+ antiporter MnhF subunit